MFEEKALSRHRSTSIASVFLLDDGTQAIEVELSATEIKESSDDRTDHISEETIGRDGELKHSLVFNIDPFRLRDTANIGFCVCM